jgi:hypothetical protein
VASGPLWAAGAISSALNSQQGLFLHQCIVSSITPVALVQASSS